MSRLAKLGNEQMVERRWRHLLSSVNDSVAILGRDSQIHFFNHNDKVPFDLIGRRTVEFIASGERNEYLRKLQTTFDSGEDAELIYTDIAEQSWQSRLTPLRDEQGEVEAVLAIGVQVDADGNSPMQIRELQMRTAVETTGMGLWSLDLSSGMFVLDARSCELHEIPQEKGRELHIDEFVQQVSEDYRQLMHSKLAIDVLRSAHSPIEEFEYQLGANTRWLSCRGNTICDGAGEVQCAVGAFFDVSDRKLLQEQLLQVQKMEAVGQLTAGVAKNFNQILAAVLPNLDQASKYVAPAGAVFVRNAHIAADRAAELARELSIVAGQMRGEKRRSLDLNEVAERVVRICRTTFGGGVKLVFDERATLKVVATQSQIEQLLLNLLLNARDALQEANVETPSIRITLDRVDEGGAPFALIRVSDNGPGMKPAIQSRVFEPFFTTRETHTGMGLATASAILRSHAGEIRCESRAGETIFEALLPTSTSDEDSLA